MEPSVTNHLTRQMQEIRREEYGRYGLSLLSLAAKTEHLSIDDQAALSPSSFHTSSSGIASSESQAPSFTESPPSSETSAGEYGDSESTSRTSCSENIPGSLRVSIYDLDDAIITHAEVVGSVHNIFPADFADNSRTGTNSIIIGLAQILFPKDGPTILKTLSHSVALLTPMNMI